MVTVDYSLTPPVNWFRAPQPGPLTGIRYPVPLDDVIDVFGAMLAGIPDGRLILGVASAGACLAAAAALRLVAEDRPGPSRLVLAYGTFHAALPPLSPRLRSRIRGRHGIAQTRAGSVERMNRNYAGSEAAMADPLAFPGGHDLRGLPPTLMLDSDRDSLRASGEAFADELRGAGVPVERHVLPESKHGFFDRPGKRCYDEGIALTLDWLGRSADHTDLRREST